MQMRAPILVDIANPISEDFKGLLIGHTTSAAEEIQKFAPKSKVVKAFNTIFAQLLPAEAREGRASVQVFVAGDDEAAKKAVSDIVAKGGFEPVAGLRVDGWFGFSMPHLGLIGSRTTNG
jgi:8-hydroxy-5-deazaflavin:NADPH oxidoreductase